MQQTNFYHLKGSDFIKNNCSQYLDKIAAIRFGRLFLLVKIVKREEEKNMFYKKELLENMLQGARLRFIRENKGIKPNDIAKYLGN